MTCGYAKPIRPCGKSAWRFFGQAVDQPFRGNGPVRASLTCCTERQGLAAFNTPLWCTCCARWRPNRPRSVRAGRRVRSVRTRPGRWDSCRSRVWVGGGSGPRAGVRGCGGTRGLGGWCRCARHSWWPRPAIRPGRGQIRGGLFRLRRSKLGCGRLGSMTRPVSPGPRARWSSHPAQAGTQELDGRLVRELFANLSGFRSLPDRQLRGRVSPRDRAIRWGQGLLERRGREVV